MNPQDSVAVRRCVCAALRRTDRAITQFYDTILAKSGVPITQFTLLGTLASAGPLALNRLPELLFMDPTPFTRNIPPPPPQACVRIEEGEERSTLPPPHPTRG